MLLYIYLTVLILLDWRSYEGYAGTWCVADIGGEIDRPINILGSKFYRACIKNGAVDSCCVNTDDSNTFVWEKSGGC
jgi:hypothetical protein